MHLVGRDVFDVVADVPAVERIADRSRSLAVERILRSDLERRAGGDRLLDHLVGIIDVDVNRHRRALPWLGATMPYSGNSSHNISVVPLRSTSA